MFNRMGDAYAAEDDGCLRRVMAVPLGILYALVITVSPPTVRRAMGPRWLARPVPPGARAGGRAPIGSSPGPDRRFRVNSR